MDEDDEDSDDDQPALRTTRSGRSVKSYREAEDASEDDEVIAPSRNTRRGAATSKSMGDVSISVPNFTRSFRKRQVLTQLLCLLHSLS